MIGRHFIYQVIEEYPCLLLPPIMETLKHEYVRNGLGWIKENVASLQKQFLLLKSCTVPLGFWPEGCGGRRKVEAVGGQKL